MQADRVSVERCPVLSILKIKKRGCLHLPPVFRPFSVMFVPLGALVNSPLSIPQQGLALQGWGGSSPVQGSLQRHIGCSGLGQMAIEEDGDATTTLVHVPGLHRSHRERFFLSI